MISWRRAVMTPASCRWVSLGRMGQPHACDREHTEGMPDDERQLGDLFALLAELHERRFSTGRIQEFRHQMKTLRFSSLIPPSITDTAFARPSPPIPPTAPAPCCAGFAAPLPFMARRP